MTVSDSAPTIKRRKSQKNGDWDPRQIIFDTAERLCAEKGLEAVSVRDIAKAADVSLAALNYYYGSLNNLLLTILKTRIEELRLSQLDTFEALHQSPKPDLRTILRAVLEPLARWRAPNSNRHAAVQFLSRAILASEPTLKQHIDSGIFGFRPVLDLLQRALPHLSFEEICWRFHFLMAIEHMNQWDSERLLLLSDNRCNANNHLESLERALDFAVAGFRVG